jgi:hypothetical protein
VHGSAIDFASDGTFTSTALPHQLFDDFPGVLPTDFDPAHDDVSACGRWSLSAPAVDPNGPKDHVSLFVTSLMGRRVSGGADLRAESDGSSVVLVFYIGDPDLRNRYVYRQQ